MTRHLAFLAALLVGAAPLPTEAQRPAAPAAQRPAAPAAQLAPPSDSLRLGALQRDAVRRDPRAAQLELLGAQSSLRQRNLDAERLPTVGVNGQAQYQSDVLSFPFAVDGGRPPILPKDTYDANLAVRQRLWDPGLAPRRDVERAQLEEARARVRSSLFALRQDVSDAYFASLRLQAESAVLEAGVADLEAQLRVATERLRGGTALPSEPAALEAELLRRRQSIAALAAERGATLVVLGDLVGRPVSDADALALPDLAADVAQLRARLDALRTRPEYEQFARSREVLDQQRASASAQDRPRVTAFGRAGYGKPGLNPLRRDFDEYWLAGVQVEWSPWGWGTTRREREELVLQQRIVATEEAAFAEGIRRGTARDLAAIDRLERTLGDDDAIIALRERILGETRLRFREGVVTSAEYVDRETDLLTARLARATHRVELAEARARLLTLLGVEVR